jgi:anti-sigma28 factor (negative regulator of flagellin synthesis)
MNVREIRPESGPGSAAPIQPVRGVEPREPTRGASDTRDRQDRVEISDEARALAAQEEVRTDGTLDAERILELRRWVQSGGYDDPQVVDKIARRLLDLGEV